MIEEKISQDSLTNIEGEHIDLERKLGLFDSVMIVIGIVIGTGIFLTTGIIARSIPSPSLILLVFVVGGILSFAGSLIYAELGAAMPQAGGQYVYIREAYGPLFGFLFGWVMILVYMTGAIAACAVAFSEYLGYFFPSLGTNNYIFTITINIFNHSLPYSLSMGQIVGIAIIIILSYLNYFGLIFGAIIQNIFTILKIGALVGLVVLGFSIGKGEHIRFSLVGTEMSLSSLLMGFGVAMIAIIWTYGGWNCLSFTAGEIKNPKRNIPLSLFLGVSLITVIYAAVNYIYLYALPIDEITGVVRIAEKAATALFGGTGASLISAAVIISVFGALNATILTGARVYYAMAKDNLFFKRVANVHPRYRTPGFSIFIQAAWSCVLTLTGTFEQLITYVTFVLICYYIAAAASLFTLRKKFPNLSRPYKVWGYPVVPLLYLIFLAALLLNTLVNKPVESIAGLGFVAIGVPVYFYWKKKDSKIPLKAIE
jgi:APA family basic amino acid/polyamine antiporter